MISTAFLVTGLFVMLYAFLVYPGLLMLLGRGKGDRRETADAGHAPPAVSVVVAIHNEGHQLEGLLQSLHALRYPGDLQVLIVSDGSTDETDEILRAWEDRGFEYLRTDSRQGKTAAENLALDRIRGEVIVNTDASVRFRPDALEPLVAPFRDPGVGVTSGRDVSVSYHGEDVNAGEAGYVTYEMWVRSLETAAGGIVGASGSIYAVRADLYRVPFSPEISRDFASVLLARLRGLRAISVPEAVCFVPRTRFLKDEYRRKVRTVAGGLTTLLGMREAFRPLSDPGFTWRLFSHKILRWMIPFAVLLVLLGLAMAALTDLWARAALVGVGAIGIIGSVGLILDEARGRVPGIVSFPAYFMVSNLAILHGVALTLTDFRPGIWEPTRR